MNYYSLNWKNLKHYKNFLYKIHLYYSIVKSDKLTEVGVTGITQYNNYENGNRYDTTIMQQSVTALFLSVTALYRFLKTFSEFK